MTKDEAVQERSAHIHLKGKMSIKKQPNNDSADTARITHVAALPGGLMMLDPDTIENPNNFEGTNWNVYVIIRPYIDFYLKVDINTFYQDYSVEG